MYEDIYWRYLSREPMKGRKSLVPEWNLKQEYGREMNIDYYSWNERNV
jgi:hypothetical protein